MILNQVKSFCRSFTLSHHPALLREICKEAGIIFYYDAFINLCRNDRFHLSYHNVNHMTSVALNCVEAVVFYYCDRNDSKIELLAQNKTLILAGMFHDVGHTLGQAIDLININIAIDIFTKLNKHLNVNNQFLTDEEVEEVISLIKVTEYPYTRKTTTLNERIICDADLMTIFEPYLVKQELSYGLFNEINTSRNLIHLPRLTIKEFNENQNTFLNNVRYKTQWGRCKSDLYYCRALKETNDIILNMTE